MEEVGAGGADFSVGAGDLRLGFSAVRGPLLTAGHAPLIAGQVPGLTLQVPRVGDPLPVAGDREVLDPQVHPRDPAGGGEAMFVAALDPGRRRVVVGPRGSAART